MFCSARALAIGSWPVKDSPQSSFVRVATLSAVMSPPKLGSVEARLSVAVSLVLKQRATALTSSSALPSFNSTVAAIAGIAGMAIPVTARAVAASTSLRFTATI